MHNIWYYLTILIFLSAFIFDLVIDVLNYTHTVSSMDPSRKELSYFKANFKVSQIGSVVSSSLILGMLLTGGFGKLDSLIISHTSNEYFSAVLYFGIIGLVANILAFPLSVYRTFTIEERFGFNKTTVKTFVLDKVKSLFLGVVIGGGLLALIVWIYNLSPERFWLFAWATVTIVMVAATMLFTTVFLPMFNKLYPLEDGDLRLSIEDLCMKLNFPLKKLYVMDGSKRSTKANAFFSGLGPKKAIVLYDTLVNNYSKDEILAVLAHEIGHYKKKHTLKTLTVSFIQSAVMFYLLGVLLRNEQVSFALGGTQRTFELSVTAFGILYSPVSMLLSLLMNSLSRKHEYEADAFARENFSGESLSSALTKLHKDSLSNPHPHPAYVAVHYSHPTLKQRLERLRKQEV